MLAGQLNVNVIGFLMMQKQLDEWHVIVRESGVTAGESSVTIRRLADGRVIEAYAPQPPGVAAVFLAAIIQGFQPPRGLVPLDKPAG